LVTNLEDKLFKWFSHVSDTDSIRILRWASEVKFEARSPMGMTIGFSQILEDMKRIGTCKQQNGRKW
jgi:hypothetical protein